MRKSVSLSDFNLGLCGEKNCKYGIGKKVCNVNCQDGRLITNYGFTSLYELLAPNRSQVLANVIGSTIGQIIDVFCYQTYNEGNLLEYVIFCSADYKIYYYMPQSENPQVQRLTNINLTSKPKLDCYIKNGVNLLLITTATDDMWVWDGVNEPYDVLDAPKISSEAIGLNRLFVTSTDKPFSVLYSDDLDPSNWSMSSGEAGEITFSDDMGRVLNVFALQNYIFVIRERGINKIYGSGNNNFNIARVYTSTGKIFKDSVCICGDNVIYLTTDGLYSFDGLNGKKIYAGLDSLFKNTSYSMAVSQDNKIYICTNLYEECTYNNCLVILDLSEKDAFTVLTGKNFNGLFKLELDCLRGVCILEKNAENANLPLLVLKNDCNLSEFANFEYFTHFINIAPKDGLKTLSSIEFTSVYPINIAIKTETHCKNISAFGKQSHQKFLLNLPGKTFSLKFFGTGKMQVDNIKINYCYVE